MARRTSTTRLLPRERGRQDSRAAALSRHRPVSGVRPHKCDPKTMRLADVHPPPGARRSCSRRRDAPHEGRGLSTLTELLSGNGRIVSLTRGRFASLYITHPIGRANASGVSSIVPVVDASTAHGV